MRAGRHSLGELRRHPPRGFPEHEQRFGERSSGTLDFDEIGLGSLCGLPNLLIQRRGVLRRRLEFNAAVTASIDCAKG